MKLSNFVSSIYTWQSLVFNFIYITSIYILYKECQKRKNLTVSDKITIAIYVFEDLTQNLAGLYKWLVHVYRLPIYYTYSPNEIGKEMLAEIKKKYNGPKY